MGGKLGNDKIPKAVRKNKNMSIEYQELREALMDAPYWEGQEHSFSNEETQEIFTEFRKQVEAMLGIIAFELRTPQVGAIGFLHHLKQSFGPGDLSEEQSKYLDEATKSMTMNMEYINDLQGRFIRDIAKKEEDQAKYEKFKKKWGLE